MIFGKNRLYVTTKGMRVSFSTALMCLSNSSELYPSRNCCLHSLQWCSKSFDMAQIRLILSAWLYRILSFNDFGCSESIWRKIKVFSIYFGVIFVVLDIHLCIQKRNTGFWNFVLIFNESCFGFNSPKFRTICSLLSVPIKNISSMNLK